MTKDTKDYSAIKFKVSEALGEWMNCLYLKWDRQGQMDFNFIHHTDSDGASALTKIQEAEGSIVPSVPTQKKILKANFLEKIFLLKKFVKLTKPVAINWAQSRKDTTGVASSFFIMRFTLEQTQNLERVASERGVSANSLLLWAIDQATSALLLKENSERKWVCPINMRVSQQERYGNHSASIIMNILSSYKDTTPEFFQSYIRHFLKSQMHWGSQIYSNMARYIGFKGTLHIAKKIKEIGTGVFSNMGAWPQPDTQCSKESNSIDHRMFVAPATQVLPVASGAFIWQGRLSLSLQIHPSLQQSEEMAQKVAQKWVENLGIAEDFKVDKYHWKDFDLCPKHLIITT